MEIIWERNVKGGGVGGDLKRRRKSEGKSVMGE